MRKFKYCFVAFILALALIATNVGATSSAYYYSLAGQTGTEVSYRSAQTVEIASMYDAPDSGNVDVYFFQTDVGLSDSFVHTTNRRGLITVKEYDFVFNDTVCYYTGYFNTNSAGNYRMTSYSRTEAYATPECIENDSTLELYLIVDIETVSGDRTRNYPASLFQYRYVVE